MRNTLRSRRALRREAGLLGNTQWDVAVAAGLSRDRYVRIENGKAEPTPAECDQLAAFFGVKVSVLFPREPKSKGNGAVA